MQKKSVYRTIGLLIVLCIFGLVVYSAVAAARGVEEARASEELRFAEEAIRRAAITCYCIEGRFPESYGYLRDKYGLLVDEERFTLHYSIFAQNIMPEITVIKK